MWKIGGAFVLAVGLLILALPIASRTGAFGLKPVGSALDRRVAVVMSVLGGLIFVWLGMAMLAD